MIRKLASGKYRLYSRKKDPKTGRRRNLGTFGSRAALVHPDTAAARQSVLTVIERYRRLFEQQSVLWETARVCVAS